MTPPHCLGRCTFDAAALHRDHPPVFKHAHKRAVYAQAMASGPARGTLEYARWDEPSLPAVLPTAVPRVEVRPDVFGYGPEADGVVPWYLNFAHTVLFVAYGGPLLAQDELQVLEHPALGAVREALKGCNDPGLRPVTRDAGRATPVLLSGVERRCALATDADADAGRPMGLYGNQFARARVEAVMGALRVLDPPTRSNLVAMEAPPGGTGPYTRAQIESVLRTAHAGFAAVRAETARVPPGARVVVHTGHWGTGAYGGDRVLMALLQLVAARLAGLESVVFHTVSSEGMAPVDAARDRLVTLGGGGQATDDVLDAIAAMGFVWGQSDGN